MLTHHQEGKNGYFTYLHFITAGWKIFALTIEMDNTVEHISFAGETISIFGDLSKHLIVGEIIRSIEKVGSHKFINVFDGIMTKKEIAELIYDTSAIIRQEIYTC